ncbi:hypothetical protein F2Q70_00009702 [Brassica cretica]|uniref:Uncharacterized protein n=1 Tax=Brassica cretica TaxID=69181 RepID=A0A8S9JB31_BRACR|nr:hypothetical protein F2Q68_00002708 [Brassica cretica]KAF2612754.1 hypothetical protein F2Q70_00009702 [Brassica cretica]
MEKEVFGVGGFFFRNGGSQLSFLSGPGPLHLRCESRRIRLVSDLLGGGSRSTCGGFVEADVWWPWDASRVASLTVTGAVSCAGLGLPGLELPRLSDLNVTGSNRRKRQSFLVFIPTTLHSYSHSCSDLSR